MGPHPNQRYVVPHQAMDVLQTPIGWNSNGDLMFWPTTKDGCYSVKQGYASISGESSMSSNGRASSSLGIDPNVWQMIWKANIPEKIKVFLWKAAHNVLPVRHNLTQKRIAITNLCPVCQKEPKTIEHTLLLCEWTSPIWFGRGVVHVPNANNITRFDQWLLSSLKSCSAANLMENGSLIAYACWSIWKARNDLLFSEKKTCPVGVIITAKSQCLKFMKACDKDKGVGNPNVQGRSVTKWRPKGFHSEDQHRCSI